ncbi:MAG: hypothetical protein ACP5G0_07510 [Desulfomonilia bacterium]
MGFLHPGFSEEMIECLKGRVRTSMGIPGPLAVSHDLEGMVTEAVDTFNQVSRSRAIYTTMPVISRTSSEILTRTGSISSPRFARLASRSTGDLSIVFMVATLGEHASSLAQEQKTLLSSLVYDTMLSEAVELAADTIEDALHREMRMHGLEMTSRFSPGYCDWPLDGQRVIFKSVDAATIGVELNEYCVMVPEKSLSCIFLAGSTIPCPTPCSFCSKENCPWRRELFSES